MKPQITANSRRLRASCTDDCKAMQSSPLLCLGRIRHGRALPSLLVVLADLGGYLQPDRNAMCETHTLAF